MHRDTTGYKLSVPRITLIRCPYHVPIRSRARSPAMLRKAARFKRLSPLRDFSRWAIGYATIYPICSGPF